MSHLERLADTIVPTIVALIFAAGCAADPDAAGAPTYHADIAPILAARCVSCHRNGAIAPFALDGYEEARAQGAAAKAAVVERRMPPVQVDASGDCGRFAGLAWLDDAEIDLVARWVDAGMAEGDPAAARPSDPPAEAGLEGDLLEVAMSQSYETVAGADDYRCFDVPLDAGGDVFATGFDVTPGNPAIVHHLVVWTYDPAARSSAGTNADYIAEMDAADGKPGWPCGAVGGGVTTSGLLALWTPGGTATRYPEGTGLALRSGERLVFEMHYYPGTTGGADRTALRLAVSEGVARPAEFVLHDGLIDTLFFGPEAVLEPGNPSVPFRWEKTTAELGVPPGPMGGDAPTSLDVYGIFPHMHFLGKSLHADVVGGGGEQCAADLPRWDFDWQRLYFYEEPIRMSSGDSVHVTCEYDTRTRMDATSPGFSTTDEMCTFGVYVVKDP